MLAFVFYAIGFFSVLTYLLPVFLQLLLRDQNLKKVYEAEWALVTGASSGIGKEIVHKLAKQGINVVLVALDDKLLTETFGEMEKLYPELRFRQVGCDLGNVDFIDRIITETRDLEIRLVFSNAGYIVPGIFDLTPLSSQMNNFNCNASSAVLLAHHFLKQLKQLPLKNGKRGLISFTSSSAGFLPSPIAALYGATKAFVTSFAAAIACEVKEDGIDVVCIHPSPVKSRFFNKAEGISLFTAFQHTATHPRVIVDAIFSNAGRLSLVDQGYFSIGAKLLLKTVDWNFMAEVSPYFMTSNADFRKLKDKTDDKEE